MCYVVSIVHRLIKSATHFLYNMMLFYISSRLTLKNIYIAKLQKSYSLPRCLRAGNISSALFLKKPLCMGNLSSASKIPTERSERSWATNPGQVLGGV